VPSRGVAAYLVVRVAVDSDDISVGTVPIEPLCGAVAEFTVDGPVGTVLGFGAQEPRRRDQVRLLDVVGADGTQIGFESLVTDVQVPVPAGENPRLEPFTTVHVAVLRSWEVVLVIRAGHDPAVFHRAALRMQCVDHDSPVQE